MLKIARRWATSSIPKQPKDPKSVTKALQNKPIQRLPQAVNKEHQLPAWQRTQTTALMGSNGKQFAMQSEGAESLRRRLVLINGLTAVCVALFAAGVYQYSIYAVQEDDITDAFLASLLKAEEKQVKEEQLTSK